jgi:Tol biopolymer transport system component
MPGRKAAAEARGVSAIALACVQLLLRVGAPTLLVAAALTVPSAGAAGSSARNGRIAADATLNARDIHIVDGTGDRRLVADGATAIEPAVTADGRRVAYVSTRDGSPQIWVVSADGGGANRLTSGAGSYQPSWSPDGRSLAFVSLRDGLPKIYVMKADGTDQRRLTKGGGEEYTPSWSPAGDHIAFASVRDRAADVYVIDIAGLQERQLTTDPGEDVNPVWSADASQLAFESDRSVDGLPDIWVMNADGSNQHDVSNFPGWEGSPSWWPGWRIMFVSQQNGSWQLFSMNPDGSGRESLTGTDSNAFFGQAAGPGFVYETDQDAKRDIVTFDGVGGGRRQLTSSRGDNKYPVFSRDGRRVVFDSTRDGNDEVYVMNADGSRQRRLTRNPAYDLDPTWSPDARRIAWVRVDYVSGKSGLFVMDADGSHQRRIALIPPLDRHPVWSSDGRTIAFESDQNGNWDVYLLRADGTGRKRVTSNRADEGGPAFSHDSQRIAFYSARNGNWSIYVMNAKGGRPRQLTRDPFTDALYPTWSPGDGEIGYARTIDWIDWDIWAVRPDGTGVRQITRGGPQERFPSWAPAAR